MEPIARGPGTTVVPEPGSTTGTAVGRRIRTARILAVGSELTSGDTRDTNASELAADLAGRGVTVNGIHLLPDDRAVIAGAFRSAFAEADLVVATGGLGPTPDDLTREALADAIGEAPEVDAELEAWVRQLWARRRIPFPESNLKQAWLVPSASALPNEHGTAPGWWVDGPDGSVATLLPGPPREMRPMWFEAVVPRLERRGFGRASVVRLFRLAGIGESHVADRLGRELLEAPNPDVATFARNDAVDVRIVALGDSPDEATTAADGASASVRAALADHVWAEGRASWSEVVDRALADRGANLVIDEEGTAGALVGLLGRCERLRSAAVRGPAGGNRVDRAGPALGDVRLSLRVAPASEGRDLVAEISIGGEGLEVRERATAFLADEQGLARTAVAAAWALVRALRNGGTAR